jgi:hypothetical protein
MPIQRTLLTEIDERSHFAVLKSIEELLKVAKEQNTHLYLITVNRQTPLVYDLKKTTWIKRLLWLSMKNINSILRWETLKSRPNISENSIVLCPYMFPSQLEIIDSFMPNNAVMIAIE